MLALSPASLDVLFPDKTGLKGFGLLRQTGPLSVLGSFLASHGDGTLKSDLNTTSSFTLEDQILLTILEALRAGQRADQCQQEGRAGERVRWCR